jgi:hypothetical protein
VAELARVAVLLATLCPSALLPPPVPSLSRASFAPPSCGVSDTGELAAPAPGDILPSEPADAWLGADKFRHLGMSFAATAFPFAAARAAGLETGDALAAAIPLSAAAGVVREVRDRQRGGAFSLRDLAANAVGIAGAYLLLREVR